MQRTTAYGRTDDNKYKEGNQTSGDPATRVTADAMNAIQEELCHVVEDSGLVLDPNDDHQCYKAIVRLSWSTGDLKLTLKTVADPGWVLANDGTIGSAASGASARAHADAQALYTLIWNNVSDVHAPVTGGRGANAAADFAANKPIALTKMLGRAIAVAGTGAGLTARTLGAALGGEALGAAAVAAGAGSNVAAVGADSNMQPTAFVNVMIKL